jgi:hypothetical protein
MAHPLLQRADIDAVLQVARGVGMAELMKEPSSGRSEGKNGPPGDKEERQRARGKDREAGRASAKQPYPLARSRAVPKGRPEAKRSGHPRPWERRKDARPSASGRLLLPCRIRQLERGRKQAGQIWLLKLIGNQHTTGTHGKSQTWRAWHWRLTDSQSARSIRLVKEGYCGSTGLGEVSLFRAFYRLGELASNQLWMVRRVFIFRDKWGSLEKRIVKHVTLLTPRVSLP